MPKKEKGKSINREKNGIPLSYSLTQLCFLIKILALQTNDIKDRELLTNHIVLYRRSTYVKPDKTY